MTVFFSDLRNFTTISEKRQSTELSDVLNLYACKCAITSPNRLEGITTEYGVKVIISELTYEQIKNDFICRELDWVRVKGKLQPVKIYELLGEKNDFSARSSFLQLFNQGYQSYRQKDFLTALQFFRSALDLKPKDLPSEIYIERCEDYLKNPPPTDWDGVYVMKTK